MEFIYSPNSTSLVPAVTSKVVGFPAYALLPDATIILSLSHMLMR